jgi:hypothetical protein
VSPSADAPSFFISSGMGSDFRSFLSSFGDGLESDFDPCLSALGVGFDSGFDSGLSGFVVTMVVLLFLLPPPGASPGKAWKIVGHALKKKTHWGHLNSPKVDTIHAVCRQGIPDWRLQKVLTLADSDAVQFCSRKAERPNHQLCIW